MKKDYLLRAYEEREKVFWDCVPKSLVKDIRFRLERMWRAGYGEAVRRQAAGEDIDEQRAWESTSLDVDTFRCDECGEEVSSCAEDSGSCYEFRHWYIPERMMVGLRRYIEQHCPVGDFLTAVLENNLTEAFSRADDENLANMPAFVAYLYNEAPSLCWGSPEKVRAWLGEE